MRFRNRRPPGTFVRLSLPDQIQRRHWIVFGPAGEGTFADTYRAQVEHWSKTLPATILLCNDSSAAKKSPRTISKRLPPC